MAGPGGDGDLRRLLKLHRTEIAMAVDDVFPLLHGLADHDVVPEHMFTETLSRTEREGSHRAFHALLTWLLGRDTAALRDFWAVLFKDYNLERYSRLRPLRGTFPRGKVELGRQRRGRRLSPSPTAPASHRPQGKRKAPEERDKARVAQPSPRHSASPGMEIQSRMEMGRGAAAMPPDPILSMPQGPLTASVQRPVAVAGGEVPVSHVAIEGILIKHVLEPGSSKVGNRAGDEPYAPAACEEPETRSRSHSLKPPARPKASQSTLPQPWLQPVGVAVTPCPLPWGQENEDECAACGDGGELICCDGCPRAFHLACLVPPLPRVPSGTWRCGSCVDSMAEPGQLLEADLAVERPPETLGEAVGDLPPSGAQGSVCSHCCAQIPTSRQCAAPSGDPSKRQTPSKGDNVSGVAHRVTQGCESGRPGHSRGSTWDGILQWAFQSMAQPLTDTQGLLAQHTEPAAALHHSL
uniref:Zinc finger PHD-type domain-containing protein n=1 Tax=Malurus cyaneus samueli TaxID=2593467 RepID=A0A8C5T8Z6_9PASS